MKDKKYYKGKPIDMASFEHARMFGTYEIQPTANTENEYPFIAQGFNKKIQKTNGERKEAEK